MPAAEGAAAARYVALGAAERQRRRALFLQSYRFSVDDGGGGGGRRATTAAEGLRGLLLRRLREAGGAVARAAGRARWCVGAGLTRAWRGWRKPRAHHPILGSCFGPGGHHHRHKYHLHGYA